MITRGFAGRTSTATTASACPGSCSGFPSIGAAYRPRTLSRIGSGVLRPVTARQRVRRSGRHPGGPVERDAAIAVLPTGILHARQLDHPVESFGYRLLEPDGTRMSAHADERAWASLRSLRGHPCRTRLRRAQSRQTDFSASDGRNSGYAGVPDRPHGCSSVPEPPWVDETAGLLGVARRCGARSGLASARACRTLLTVAAI